MSPKLCLKKNTKYCKDCNKWKKCHHNYMSLFKFAFLHFILQESYLFKIQSRWPMR